MKSGRWVLWMALAVPVAALTAMTGCNRTYPVTPKAAPTATPTQGTPLPTHTFTNSRTATFTKTPTITPTGMMSATWTVSRTPSFTPTVTMTPTVTSTPLPPLVIDDFEDDNLVINGVLGITNPGSWYVTSDGSCSPVLSLVSPGAHGAPGDNYAGQITASGCATFGELGFWFADDVTTNGTSVDAMDNTTGVRFDINKAAGNVASVRFQYVDDTTSTSAEIPGASCYLDCDIHYGQDLTLTDGWQPVTVFWQNCNYPTWYTGTHKHPADPWTMYGMQWVVNASGQNFTIQLDNVAFVHDIPPPTPTPNCAPIDNMDDNDNRGIVYMPPACGSNGGTTGGVRCGYWYIYHDSFGGTINPDPSTTFYMSSPGFGGTGYAAQIWGTNSASGGDIYAGMGLNMTEPKSFYDLTVSGSFSGIMFEGYVGAGSSTAIRFKIPDVDTDPDGNICGALVTGVDCTSASSCCYDDYGMDIADVSSTWTNYQYTFSSLTQEGFGYSPGSFKPQQASALQWQFTTPGVAYDLWVDNVSLF